VMAIVALAVAMVVACSAAAFVVRWAAAAAPAHGPASHQWLHDELGLTDEERSALDAMEAAYQRDRTALQKEFDAARQHLADVIVRNGHYGPEVTEAVHALHAVHGRLQDLAIQHYYDMLAKLPPNKQERLRGLAVKALSTPQ